MPRVAKNEDGSTKVKTALETAESNVNTAARKFFKLPSKNNFAELEKTCKAYAKAYKEQPTEIFE